MATPQDAFWTHDIPDSESFCRYFHSVVVNSDWIARRIESVTISDLERCERRVSIDIDMSKLNHHATDLPTEYLYIPLCFLEKGLIVDFDVFGPDGKITSLATSDNDTNLWVIVLTQSIVDAGGAALLTSELTGEIRQIVRPIAPWDELGLAKETLQSESGTAWKDSIIERVSTQTKPIWKKLLRGADQVSEDFSEFSSLLKFAIVNFIPVIAVKRDLPQAIVKYRIVETQRPETVTNAVRKAADNRKQSARFQRRIWNSVRSSPYVNNLLLQRPLWGIIVVYAVSTSIWHLFLLARWLLYFASAPRFIAEKSLMAFGLRSREVSIPTPSIGRAQREQLRVIAPQGLEFSGGLDQRKSRLPKGTATSESVTRVTPERVVVYTRSFPCEFGNSFGSVLFLRLRPHLGGFIWPAFSVIAVNMIVSAIVFLNAADIVKHENASRANGIVTLLLLASSLYSVYVIRHDEHKLRARMLRFIRVLIGLSGGLTGLSGLGVGLAKEALIGWPLAASFSLSGVALLSAVCWAAGGVRAGRKVRAGMADSVRWLRSGGS